MLLFVKEVAYCFATIVPSIYRPSVAFGSSAYIKRQTWYNGCPKRANYEDQFSDHEQRSESNSWFLYQVFPTQYLKTFTSIMFIVTKLDQVVVPSKLMIGIDSQVKDHGQLASLCTHPSLPIF